MKDIDFNEVANTYSNLHGDDSIEGIENAVLEEIKGDEHKSWRRSKFTVRALHGIKMEIQNSTSKIINAISDTNAQPLRLYKDDVFRYGVNKGDFCRFNSLVSDEVFEKWYNVSTDTDSKKILHMQGTVGSGKNIAIENFVDYIVRTKGRDVYRAVINCYGDLSVGDVDYVVDFTRGRLRYGLGLEAIIKANEEYNNANDISKAPLVILQFDEYTLAPSRAIDDLRSFLSNTNAGDNLVRGGVRYKNTPNLIVIMNGNLHDESNAVNVSTAEHSAWLSRCYPIDERDFNPACSDYAMNVYSEYYASKHDCSVDEIMCKLEDMRDNGEILDMRSPKLLED